MRRTSVSIDGGFSILRKLTSSVRACRSTLLRVGRVGGAATVDVDTTETRWCYPVNEPELDVPTAAAPDAIEVHKLGSTAFDDRLQPLRAACWTRSELAIEKVPHG